MSDSRHLCSALSALQIVERGTPEHTRILFPQMIQLGVPKELLILRSEALDLLSKEQIPYPRPSRTLEEARARCKLQKEDAIISDGYRIVVEGIIGWYKDNKSRLTSETCKRFEALFSVMRHHWYCQTVTW